MATTAGSFTMTSANFNTVMDTVVRTTVLCLIPRYTLVHVLYFLQYPALVVVVQCLVHLPVSLAVSLYILCRPHFLSIMSRSS